MNTTRILTRRHFLKNTAIAEAKVSSPRAGTAVLRVGIPFQVSRNGRVLGAVSDPQGGVASFSVSSGDVLIVNPVKNSNKL